MINGPLYPPGQLSQDQGSTRTESWPVNHSESQQEPVWAIQGQVPPSRSEPGLSRPRHCLPGLVKIIQGHDQVRQSQARDRPSQGRQRPTRKAQPGLGQCRPRIVSPVKARTRPGQSDPRLSQRCQARQEPELCHSLIGQNQAGQARARPGRSSSWPA